MSSHKVICSPTRGFNVEFPPVMISKIRAERIFRFAAMYLINILLALAVESGVKIKRNVLAA